MTRDDVYSHIYFFGIMSMPTLATLCGEREGCTHLQTFCYGNEVTKRHMTLVGVQRRHLL